MRTILYYLCFTTMAIITWAAIIFYGTVDGWFHRSVTTGNTSEDFVEAAQHKIEEQFVGNFALALITHGDVEVEQFYSAAKPVDRNTVFQVASLSKWVTAFGMMKLVEDGKLSLDSPVSVYLTRWQLPTGEFDNNGVTIRRLLSHTAGLTDGLGYAGFENVESMQTLEQSLTKAADADPGVNGSVHVGIQPGTSFNYSGGGYTLLQLVVEEVSGQSFNSFMSEFVFQPLKMTHSTYCWNDSSELQLAQFYNSNGSPAKHYRYTAAAAASLYTTLSDLEMFFKAHVEKDTSSLAGNVLEVATIRSMRVPEARKMGVDIWGLGTVLYGKTSHGDFIIGHDGKSSPAANTAMRVDPETGNGIIVLATGNSSIATKLASEWVYWKTGQVDTLLFPSLVRGMFETIAIGSVFIILTAIMVKILSNRKQKRELPQR